MQSMRYLNLLDKISKVKTRKCFIYNETLYFAVDKKLVSKAIGIAASNIKKIRENIDKKVRIISEPNGLEDAKKFIENVVYPIKPKNVEVVENQIIVAAGNMQNKASLIGRNKKKFFELKKIVQDFFSKDLRIV